MKTYASLLKMSIKNFIIILLMIHMPALQSQTQRDYQEFNLIIQSEEINIGGTLLLPFRQKNTSLVIMSSGSGQQDRDETLDGFKIFKGIAQHLATQGIASFRYDDRGVGESNGNFVESSIEDFRQDIVRIMDYFMEQSDHKFNSFMLFGHSLGGIITGDVASVDQRVKKIVLMASPSVPLIDLILFQERQNYQNLGIPVDRIEAEISSHNRLMKAIHKNEKVDEILVEFEKNVKHILDIHPKHKDVSDAEKNNMARAKAEEFHIVYGLPSIESYLYHNPSINLSKLNIPVLGIFGGRDKQVTIDQNKDKLEDALLEAKTDYQIRIFNEANHYFQKAITGNRDEYSNLEKVFVNGFLDAISSFILNN